MSNPRPECCGQVVKVRNPTCGWLVYAELAADARQRNESARVEWVTRFVCWRCFNDLGGTAEPPTPVVTEPLSLF